jgi:cytochrome c-type biogenesis protein CcmH
MPWPERRVLEEKTHVAAPLRQGSPRGTLALLVLAVPVLALALYALLGNPQALGLQPQAAAEPTPQEMEEMVERLAQRMEQQPPGQAADVQGWVVLGRTYAAMQRFEKAQHAFGKALQIAPGDAQVLADQADVTAMLQSGSLQGEPGKLIERALQADPGNLKALALAGSAAFERKDYAAAIAHWSRARQLGPAEGEFAQGLERGIADARAAAGPAALVATQPVAPGGTAAASAPASPGGGLRGRISLAPSLAAKVLPGDTLFVFARAAEGPRIPLAILRRSAAELPLDFKLDDSMAMSPELKLSNFAQVVVGARISRSGDAMPASGDLEGSSAVLGNGTQGVELVIDRVRQ